MEKIEARFHFSEEYKLNHTVATQKVTVVLTVHYVQKKYSIRPYPGGDHFGFIDTSHHWPLWKAVLKAINEAIDFANKELEL